VVLDACSRRIVGWSMADHLPTELVLDASTWRSPSASPLQVWSTTLTTAANTPAWHSAAASSRPAWSLDGTVGDALDNAVAESCFATLECELLDRYHWPTRQALRTAVFDFVEVFYNRQPRPSTLDYLTPTDHEQQHRPPAPAA
jgi:putative transposase